VLKLRTNCSSVSNFLAADGRISRNCLSHFFGAPNNSYQ